MTRAGRSTGTGARDGGGPAELPYGAWPSPITAADVARAGRALSFPAIVGDEVWWTESRPDEAGRSVVVAAGPDGNPRDVTPPGWNARTRVHEYGGRAYLALSSGSTVFANWDDQRLVLLRPGGHPEPLTPEPTQPPGLRYALPTLAPAGTHVWCVRESHGAEGAVARALVAVPLDGSGADDPAAVRVLYDDGHFYDALAFSPDGARVAWITWEHPHMPWDGTRLMVADLTGDGGLAGVRAVLGGDSESVLQPTWTGPTGLVALSDRSGWWNPWQLDAVRRVAPRPLVQAAEEYGFPPWVLGLTTYALLDDGRLAVLHGVGEQRLAVLDPADGSVTTVPTPYTSWGPYLVADGTRVVGVASAADLPDAVVQVDVATGAVRVVHADEESVPDKAYLPSPRAVVVPGTAGRAVHALVYPPASPVAVGSPGTRAPYVVLIHGGPTAHVVARLDLTKAYFTSRGIGVVDVNYGGSTGYGRAYRELLREQWGVVDVQDAVAVARWLVATSGAAEGGVAIKGGSAGGWTVLSALTRTDAFAAGISYFGVAELLAFAAETHDFESRYLDGLVGPLPQQRERYVQRAPLTHAHRLACPVLLLQGLDDRIVPPSQSEMFRDAAAAKGIAHAYLAFEGEGHGFRRADTNATCLEAELSFLAHVFGFTPPGVPAFATFASR